MKKEKSFLYLLETTIFLYLLIIGLSFTVSFSSLFVYFMKLSALLGFTSLFFATITRPFLRIFGKLNDMKSVRISLYFSLIAVIFIIIHLILLIYNVFVKNFSFPSNLGNIFIFLLGFVALFLIIITYITRIFKTHLNFKMWTFFNSLNYIALVFIFVHGILFDIGLRSIGILIFFTILLIISIQTNVYGRFKTEKKIEDKNKLQNLISKFSSRFLFKANINKGINEFLHDLGIICGADRAYLFLFDKEYNFMKNTHEWTKENVAPQIHLLQNLPFENYQWWVEKIKKGEYIHIKDVSKLPSEASTERNLLEKQRIKSLLVFPIRIKDEVLGFLGLDNIQNTDAWDKEDFKLLRISSELIGNVLEYKSTLKELDMSEEKYKIITENANDIIIIINERYELEYLNEITNKRLLGTSGKNLYGTNILKYIHPDDRIKVLNALRKGLKEGEGIIESRIQHKLGYYAWFELKGKRIYDKREKEFKGIIVAREITERKNAEQQLKESEKKYRHLFKNSPSFIILLNRDGKIIDCNQAAETISGYRREELIGQIFKDKLSIPQKFFSLVLERFNLLIKGEKLAPASIQLHKKDGTLIWITYTSTLVDIGDKNCLLIIGYDVSKQKQAETLIKKELKKLKELEKMRKSLISRVSHELKTPLMSIRGVTELFMGKHQYDLDQEDVDLLQILERGEKRLEELIKNLIDISRIEYNEVQLEKQYVDLSHLFKDCIFEMNHLINKKCLSLYLDIPSDLLLNIDPTRIEQVIINLLMNSIKNTPSNGKITIYGKKSPLKVEISICDTGIGLTEKEKEILFTRFGKIERNEEGLENISIQGAGLGLFISKNIIEMHGGNIWAESDGRNKGSKFIFTLPIKNNLKN